MWLHGDLHPANVRTADGMVCGVIDFGDLCAGDPAYDLAAAWLLLPDDAADRYRPAPVGVHPPGPRWDASSRRPADLSARLLRPRTGRLTGLTGHS